MSKLKEWDVCPYCGSESIDIVTYGQELEHCGCRVCGEYDDGIFKTIRINTPPDCYYVKVTKENVYEIMKSAIESNKEI